MAFCFLVSPWAVTTTSSRSSVSGDIVTLTTLSAVILMSCIPMQEKTSVLPFGTFIRVYCPDSSVTEPLVVPCTNTDAPTTGSPSSAEVTVPLTVMFCANAVPTLRQKHSNKECKVLLISLKN